jgi:hypothetical protein
MLRSAITRAAAAATAAAPSTTSSSTNTSLNLESTSDNHHNHQPERTQRKKKTVQCSDGQSRDIDCDVELDEYGNEIAGQQWDEHGNNITPHDQLQQPYFPQPKPGTAEYRDSPAPFAQNYEHSMYKP